MGTQSTSHPQNHDPTCAILAQMGNQSGRLACKLPTNEHTLRHAGVRTRLGLSEDRGAPRPLLGMSRSPKTRFSSTRWLENQQASAPPHTHTQPSHGFALFRKGKENVRSALSPSFHLPWEGTRCSLQGDSGRLARPRGTPRLLMRSSPSFLCPFSTILVASRK